MHRIATGTSVVVSAVATLLLAAPQSANAALPSDFELVGHRGYPAEAVTENTLESFQRAVDLGVQAVEFDVRVTADGGLLVMHDATLTRTTTCDGAAVNASSLEWITSTCKGEVGGEAIPALETVLQWLSTNEVDAVVNPKLGGWTDQRIAAFVEMVRAHGLSDRVVVISPNSALLRAVEAQAPELRTQLIAETWEAVRAQRALDGPGSRLDGFIVDPGELTTRRVTRLHRAGYAAWGPLTNRLRDWRRLRRVHADGVLVDQVERFQNWR